VRQALMGGFASSRILEVHAERMLNGTFNPGFRIRLHQKDLNLALSAAKELTCPCPTRPSRSRCSHPVPRMVGLIWTIRR
jgi:2-hydroxy-3-oxopropionate reductase